MLFDMVESVRNRTPLPPTDEPIELAIQQVIEELVQQLEATRAASEQGDEAALADNLREVVAAARLFVHHWGAVDVTSPFRGLGLDHVGPVLDEVSELAWDAGMPIGGAIDELRERIVILKGRLAVSAALLPRTVGASYRAIADRCSVALGTFADLVNGKAGPPSPKTAQLIDAELGTSVEAVARDIRERARQIRARAKERERLRAASSTRPPADRLGALTFRLASDDELAELVARLIALPADVRAGLRSLVDALVASRPGER
jgi:hypothetical protein